MTDVTDATFGAQVMERSSEVPVVVDLWAEWCGPCKQLGPIIEKVIAETNGKVELAKVDVDGNPQIAQAFQAQSIPAVHAIANGQVVDSFIGAQGEDFVRAFVEKLIPEGAEDEPDDEEEEVEPEPDPEREAALVGVEDKLEALLPKVKTDDEAREQFVELLELMGPDHPRTADFRKRLTSALF